MAVPNIFGSATSAIPLSQLDQNFATAITLGNTAVYLGNTTTTLGNVTLTNVTVSSGNVTVTGANVSGNLTFTGTGNRITGDMSNATPANRVAFQSSTTNGNTNLEVLTNGTSVQSGISFANSSDLANNSLGQVLINSTDFRFNSNLRGTGTYLPMTFYTGGSERMRIDTSGNVGIGTSSPSNAISVSRSTGEAVISITNAGSASSWLTLAPSSSGNAYIHNTSNVATIFTTNGSERMRIDSSGNVGVNNTNPTQYATSGKVLNLTGTATNSGPANLYLSGSSATLGRGFNSTEIFAIANITSASEITRITGSGANGYRAYFKIIVTGHTSGVSNGINIKEYYWDGATNAPVQISTYTGGTGTPVISFDNSTTQVCIIKLASSDGTNGFNGVMKVEWMIPVDFASNTWTIS